MSLVKVRQPVEVMTLGKLLYWCFYLVEGGYSFLKKQHHFSILLLATELVYLILVIALLVLLLMLYRQTADQKFQKGFIRTSGSAQVGHLAFYVAGKLGIDGSRVSQVIQ